MNDPRAGFWTTFAAVLAALVLGFTFQAGLGLLLGSNDSMREVGLVMVIVVVLITAAAVVRAI